MISAIENATWTVVISRGQSRNPEKRQLEQAIAEAAGQIEGVEVLMIPHLYDLPKGSDSYQRLSEISGDLIVLSWIYSRAAHWVLDRNGIQGQAGSVQLGQESDQDDVQPESEQAGAGATERVSDIYPRPDRNIHCIDMKVSENVETFADEIRRIVVRSRMPAIRRLPIVAEAIVHVDEPTSRRWYPVIDFSRCTNCMECVDFCLFGVYGVDGTESILVEQPDNCRKGCPACSRVCPENAIMFPQHKAPAIAGAQVEGDEGFKIDLSQLFGAPSKGDDPIATAARERDEQLLLAGREAVGIDDQLRKRQTDRVSGPKDPLDRLLDSLDALDL
jgi:hypothetical protein